MTLNYSVQIAAPFPSPSGESLSLVSALSNPENHQLHLRAIKVRDDALSVSIESYSHLCLQLAYVLVGASQPEQMIQNLAPNELEYWRHTDLQSVCRLQQDPSLWIPFGQRAGLILKNALLRPPFCIQATSQSQQRLYVSREIAVLIQPVLLYALTSQSHELRAVASTVIATIAVSVDGVQPHLHVQAWTNLISHLIQNLQHEQKPSYSYAAEGSLLTIQKIMEDGPTELDATDLDHLVPALIQILSLHRHHLNHPSNETFQIAALQSLVACWRAELLPAALVAHFDQYLQELSSLSTVPSRSTQQWVCRSLVTILELRSEFLAPFLSQITPFLLQATRQPRTNNNGEMHFQGSTENFLNDESIALEACDFWLTFGSLDHYTNESEGGKNKNNMLNVVAAMLPELMVVLLENMIYPPLKQQELILENEEQEQNANEQQQYSSLRPIFHRSKAASQHTVLPDDRDDDTGYDVDDEDDTNDDDDGEDNEWTLRKCAAASLDALATVYGGQSILPCLMPALQQGFAATSDPWRQEACILAFGAIADGCKEEMNAYLGQIYPYLLHLLTSPQSLPQVTCITAWALGQYAGWAIEQVQSGIQGHLLAQMTETLLDRLSDRNTKVQVSVACAFGVVTEAAEDLLTPYLMHIYQALITAMSQYQGRSLLSIFDVLGTLADCCGPSIAEGVLPSIYVPPLLQIWDRLAKSNPADRTLLPLMESMASIAVTARMNFQPYALESFDNAMCMIESVTLLLAAAGDEIPNEEDVDPIVCATDLLDGLVEGLGSSFIALLSSSQRYGPHFLNVLVNMCRHEVSGVRMSALALLGDLARNAPSILEPALAQLLEEAIGSMDTIHSSVCTNAVWAVGEICVRCINHPEILKPFAPLLLQNLIGLVMGHGDGNDDFHENPSVSNHQVAGIKENAAACIGRLAKVDHNFVAVDLPRFLVGWCDGLAKISDASERRDAFQGFVRAVYANPQAIQQASAGVPTVCVSILFAIISWHIPETFRSGGNDVLTRSDYPFSPFPPAESELGVELVKLVHDMKTSIGEQTWLVVFKGLPVNVRRLLRECYQVSDIC